VHTLAAQLPVVPDISDLLKAAKDLVKRWLLIPGVMFALTLETNLRNALADAIDDLVNTGAGTANLKFETSGDAEVATINFNNPAFGAAATGVITLQGTPLQDSSATGGTVAQFSIYNRNGTQVLEGTVATLTSLTITVPAS
jgi:hypothetical protein